MSNLAKIFNDTKRRAASLRQLSFLFWHWGPAVAKLLLPKLLCVYSEIFLALATDRVTGIHSSKDSDYNVTDAGDQNQHLAVHARGKLRWLIRCRLTLLNFSAVISQTTALRRVSICLRYRPSQCAVAHKQTRRRRRWPRISVDTIVDCTAV